MYLQSCLALICLAGATLSSAQLLDADGPDSNEVVAAPIFLQRSTAASRETARMEAGFPPTTQAAVDRALRFLTDEQNGNGSWGSGQKISTTAVALLAYLGNGETPQSKLHGVAITNGIRYLIETAKSSHGKLGKKVKGRFEPRWPVDHCLAAQALAESHYVCTEYKIQMPDLYMTSGIAIQWIIDNQHLDGGWAHGFAEDLPRKSHLEATIPAALALWLANQSDIETRNMEESLDRALGYLSGLQTADGRIPSWKNAPADNVTFTGGAAFLISALDKPTNPAAHRAVEFLARSGAEKFSYNAEVMRTLPYDALAFMHGAGDRHNAWFATRIPEVLRQQQPDGSFGSRPGKGTSRHKESAIQHAAAVCLALESPWRYHLKK